MARDKSESDFELWVGAPIRSVERYFLAFPIVSCRAHNVIHVRYEEINTVAYSNCVSHEVGFKLIGGNAFFESIGVKSETVCVSRSVCLELLGEIWKLALRELCLRELCEDV